MIIAIFLENVYNSCTVSNTSDVVIGSTGIAPIAGGNGVAPLDQDELRQMTSHLNNDCNGQSGISYVMESEINISNDYSPLRVISQPELEILCELGYQISTNNYSCNGCFSMAHYDRFFSKKMKMNVANINFMHV